MNPVKNSVVLILLIALTSKCQSRQNGSSEINRNSCRVSQTTASGKYAPSGEFCSGQLIFIENFNSLNRDLWEHEITLGGGGVSISTQSKFDNFFKYEFHFFVCVLELGIPMVRSRST